MNSLCLISGGLDSCVALAYASHHQFNPKVGLSILYGQRHAREFESAQKVAKHYNLQHIVVELPSLGEAIRDASALLNPSEILPQARSVEEMPTNIPRSYVPGRNTMMLAIAQSIAEGLELDKIFTGFNAVDYSGYPDCRPEFVTAWNHMADFATKRGIEGNAIYVDAPVIRLTKVEIVQLGIKLGAPLELTWSCYAGQVVPCGKCDSCIIRIQAFEKAGILDPALPRPKEEETA